MPKDWKSDMIDVGSESSTDNNDPIEPNEADPGPDAGDLSGNGKDGNKDDRTPEQVRAELLRKMEKGNSDLRDDFSRKLDNAVAQLTNTLSASRNTQPAAGAERSLQDQSVQELEALNRQVTDPAQKDYLQRLIVRKEVEAQVGNSLQTFDRDFASRQQRQTSMRAAFERFPEMNDSSSTFHRMVMQEMEELGDAANDPRALINVANEVGYKLGISPAAAARRNTEELSGSNVAPGRSSRPANQNTNGPAEMSPEEFEGAADGLRNAFGDMGGMTKVSKARILARVKDYAPHKNDPNNAFIKG